MIHCVPADSSIVPEHPLANLMDLVFAYLAGLLTLINPCVLPVLPIVLATALQASALGPIALAAGMGISFVTVGIAVVGFGQLIGVNSDSVGHGWVWAGDLIAKAILGIFTHARRHCRTR